MRVAVIGAGAAGLSVLRLIPEGIDADQVVCFESSSCYGGQWCQYERKKEGEYKEDPTSSMYKNLVTNLPTVLMQYPDYDWKHPQSYVHHTEVAKYLLDYCQQYSLHKYVTLNRTVTNLRRDPTNKWSISSTDTNNQLYHDHFDYVFVCAGHFSIPRLFEIPGLEHYQGDVFHSRWFDDPALYKDQTVLVVGKGLSGIDICCELMPHCKKVLVASNCTKYYFDNYSSVSEISFISKYDPKSQTFICDDGTVISEKIDSVIVCTGYSYDIPFLDRESCGIEIEDGFISPLHKFTVHSKFPSLFFIGLNQRICPFTLFYYQSVFCWSIITGKIKLPVDFDKQVEQELEDRLQLVKKRHFFNLGFEEEHELVLYFTQAANLAPPPAWLFRTRACVADARVVDPVIYKKHQLCQEGSIIVHRDEKGQFIQNIE